MKIASNVWKLNVDSNVYYLDLEEKIVIDTGPRAYHDGVKEGLSKVVKLDEIKKVILTHVHYDHSGNVDLFPNAEIFASRIETEDFMKNPIAAFNLNPKIVMLLRKKLKSIETIKDFLAKNDLQIIEVPGHTRGSIALFYKKDKILFSGDCLFENGIGRYDLPNSAPDEMDNSLKKLEKIDYKILAPGHDY
jgi:glyoxylase-like metal-dependent hydrolase (beta-lactamase superfamily II)